jgi:hypothetical protein
MTRITLTKKIRLFEDVAIKNEQGKTIGHKSVRRAIPIPADKRSLFFVEDKKGVRVPILVASGQIINPKKYLKRRARKSKI